MPKKEDTETILNSELMVLNIGLDIFRQALENQNVRCLQVELIQGPKLDKKLADALDRLL